MADTKKQVPLRLSPKLYDAVAAWAEDDFRSVNGQIEYLLTECVRQRSPSGSGSVITRHPIPQQCLICFSVIVCLRATAPHITCLPGSRPNRVLTRQFLLVLPL